MGKLTWNAKFSMGSQVIDEHHRTLIGLINQLEEGLEDGSHDQKSLRTIVDMLFDYTDYHFSEEERMMDVHGYPELAAHREEHGAFTRAVVVFREQIKKGDDPQLAIKMASYLKTWLIQHILILDKEYAIFFVEKGIRL